MSWQFSVVASAGPTSVHGSAWRGAPVMGLLDLPDGALAVVLEFVGKGPDGISDIARTSCVNKHFRVLAYEMQGRMRTLDVRSLGRRARHAVPHLARRMKCLKCVFCDRTNVTDECVTLLLDASGDTLERLSLADCRHLRALHTLPDAEPSSEAVPTANRRFGRLRELDISGSSWSPPALISLLVGASNSLTALNLSSTHVGSGFVRSGDDFGDVAAAVLGCKKLTRLNLGAPVDFVVPCLVLNVFTRIDINGELTSGLAEPIGVISGATEVCGRHDFSSAFFVSIEELSFQRNAAVNDTILAKVGKLCVKLVRLDVRGTTVSREGIDSFAKNATCAPNLTSLLLGGVESLDDETLRAVASSCQALQELDLSMHNLVGEAGIEALTYNCQHLRRLRISKNAKVTANALGKLVTHGSLETLSAVRCGRANERALRALAKERSDPIKGNCRIDVVGDDFEWTTGGG